MHRSAWEQMVGRGADNAGDDVMDMKHAMTMGVQAIAVRFMRRRTPLNVVLSVTNRCVASCAYCAIPERQTKELTTGEIFGLIDQIAAMGCQRFGIWGGEPLLRDDIGEIAAYAGDKGLFVTLDSNGLLLPQKPFVLRHLDHLVLSLDGPREAHERNRGSGSFDKVMAAVETAAGRVPLWTITVLTKNNLDSIDFILEKAREYGFLATFQLLHHNDLMGKGHASLLPSPEEYRKVIRKIIDEKKKGAPIVSSMKYLYHLLAWPDYSVPVSARAIRGARCWAGRLYCNVDTDGSVYPCSLLVGKTQALNSREVGFKRAFSHLQEQDTCASCTASCFTEYNYLYSLDISTIREWLIAMRRTKRAMHRNSLRDVT